MRFHLVTIFPEIFGSFLAASLLGKAVRGGTIQVDFVDPRDFTEDRHRSVDDEPYGGGEGMLLKPEPIVAALDALAAQERGAPPYRVLLSPQGQRVTQATLRLLAQKQDIALICGRYEGFDERISAFVDVELSLGDYVLNGGEVAAMAIIDGVARLIPGVVGNPASLQAESHETGLLNYPQYTRPRSFRGLDVPEVLLSGDHERIREWRRLQMLRRTCNRRPDLWQRFVPEPADRRILASAEAGEPGAAESAFSAPLAERTYVALLHHPVLDRDGRIVTTALTNLDLHDIARSCRTYDLAGYFIVTPLTSQQQLAGRILSHWREGHGANYHEKRAEALSLVSVAADLDQTVAEIQQRHGSEPLIVATSARETEGAMDYRELDGGFVRDRPLLLLFGTGWGLTPEVLHRADAVLRPLRGHATYNHLSVRSAAAIILDRLFGMRE